MGERGGPTMAPLNVVAALRGEERWRHFDDSVNAVSFGFVATAVLISMFLVMAIFERFLRSRSPLAEDGRGGGAGTDFRMQMGSSADLEAHAGKMEHSSPKMSMYSKEVSVLMPGHSTPTFIAYPAPAPAPCPPERMAWPLTRTLLDQRGPSSPTKPEFNLAISTFMYLGATLWVFGNATLCIALFIDFNEARCPCCSWQQSGSFLKDCRNS